MNHDVALRKTLRLTKLDNGYSRIRCCVRVVVNQIKDLWHQFKFQLTFNISISWLKISISFHKYFLVDVIKVEVSTIPYTLNYSLHMPHFILGLTKAKNTNFSQFLDMTTKIKRVSIFEVVQWRQTTRKKHRSISEWKLYLDQQSSCKSTKIALRYLLFLCWSHLSTVLRGLKKFYHGFGSKLAKR